MSGRPAPRTTFELLRRHLEWGTDRPLVIAPEGAASGSDVERESARIAGWLRASGLSAGDRVVIDLKNGVEAVTSIFGVARAGGVVVGATPQWSPTQLSHVIADADARFLVTGEQRAKQLGAARPASVLVVGGRAEGTTRWEDAGPRWEGVEPVDPEDPAILIYTSGTTGAPKGVVHPHRNVVDFARIAAGYLGNVPDDRLLWLLGWSFGYGLSQLLTMCWAGGALIVPESMLAADVVKAHERHGATGLAQVPHGWDQLISHLERTGRALSGLRYVTNAGDGPSLALLSRLPPALPGAQIILMYGQTECLRTTYLPADRFDDKRGAMGFAIPEVDVFVVTAEGRLADVDEPGELLHRGALLSPGYFRAPEVTAQRFRPCPALRDRIGDERVLFTGDFVRRDADGCHWYVSRSERMIKSSGFRFGPSEIEGVVFGLPGVRDVVAFGVEDPALGQAVELCVAADPAPGGGAADTAPILTAIRRKLPRYMGPRAVHLVSEIPRTANGKIDLRRLRELTEALRSPAGD